tara:strand:- start:31 stop:1338 length:1308 start_codon:yes stop_codon:yes gene_type:complete
MSKYKIQTNIINLDYRESQQVEEFFNAPELYSHKPYGSIMPFAWTGVGGHGEEAILHKALTQTNEGWAFNNKITESDDGNLIAYQKLRSIFFDTTYAVAFPGLELVNQDIQIYTGDIDNIIIDAEIKGVAKSALEGNHAYQHIFVNIYTTEEGLPPGSWYKYRYDIGFRTMDKGSFTNDPNPGIDGYKMEFTNEQEQEQDSQGLDNLVIIRVPGGEWHDGYASGEITREDFAQDKNPIFHVSLNTDSYEYPTKGVDIEMILKSMTLTLANAFDPGGNFITINYSSHGAPCYNKNTKIKCLINDKIQLVPIQHLTTNTQVLTQNGPKLVTKLVHHIQRNDKNDKNRMFQYKNLLLTGRHRTIVKDKPDEKINPRKYDSGYSIPCSNDPRFSDVMSDSDFDLYNFTLENKDINHRDLIEIEGILVETTSEWYLNKVK